MITAKDLRSRKWFATPHDPEMTASYPERVRRQIKLNIRAA